MKDCPIKGDYSKTTYPFVICEIQDFLDDNKEMAGLKSFLFMLATSSDGNKINKVHFIGSTLSKEALIQEFRAKSLFKNITHVLYDNSNGWNEKWGVNEELILMYRPKEIWFLSRKTKLVYNPDYSNSNP